MTQILKTIALLAVYFVTVTAQAKVVADYRKEFRTPQPTEGWAYLWNPTGVRLGDSGSYEALVKTPGVHNYSVDPKTSETGESVDSNGSWIKLSKMTMLPGRPESKSTDKLSHHVIIAYTIQAGEGGEARIVNSQIKRILKNSNERPPSPMSVYVNDKLIGADAVKGYEPFAFDVPLGQLKEGDTVYIAYGCPADTFPATAEVQFQIDVVQ